jgi:hypothetical protein
LGRGSSGYSHHLSQNANGRVACMFNCYSACCTSLHNNFSISALTLRPPPPSLGEQLTEAQAQRRACSFSESWVRRRASSTALFCGQKGAEGKLMRSASKLARVPPCPLPKPCILLLQVIVGRSTQAPEPPLWDQHPQGEPPATRGPRHQVSPDTSAEPRPHTVRISTRLPRDSEANYAPHSDRTRRLN